MTIIDDKIQENRFESKPVRYWDRCGCWKDNCDGELFATTHDKYMLGKDVIAVDFKLPNYKKIRGRARIFMTGPGWTDKPQNTGAFEHYCNKCGARSELPEIFPKIKMRMVGAFPPGGVTNELPEPVEPTNDSVAMPKSKEKPPIVSPPPIVHDPARGGFPKASDE